MRATGSNSGSGGSPLSGDDGAGAAGGNGGGVSPIRFAAALQHSMLPSVTAGSRMVSGRMLQSQSSPDLQCTVSQLLTKAERAQRGWSPKGAKPTNSRRQRSDATSVVSGDERLPRRLKTKLRERLESTSHLSEKLKAHCLERLDGIAESSADRLPSCIRESPIPDVAVARASSRLTEWNESTSSERTPTSSGESRSMLQEYAELMGNAGDQTPATGQEAMAFRLGLVDIRDLAAATHGSAAAAAAAAATRAALASDAPSVVEASEWAHQFSVDRSSLHGGPSQFSLGEPSHSLNAGHSVDRSVHLAESSAVAPRRKSRLAGKTLGSLTATAENWLCGKGADRPPKTLQRNASDSSTLHRQHWDIFWLEPVREEDHHPALGKWRPSTSPVGSWSPRAGQKLSILLSAPEAKRVTAKAKAHDIPLASPNTPEAAASPHTEWRMRSLRNSSLSRAMKPMKA